MLWTKLDSDGTLTIQADEPIEAYALRQWEKQRVAGKASLKIETGIRVDIPHLVASLGMDIIAFRAWQAKCESSAIMSEADAAVTQKKA